MTQTRDLDSFTGLSQKIIIKRTFHLQELCNKLFQNIRQRERLHCDSNNSNSHCQIHLINFSKRGKSFIQLKLRLASKTIAMLLQPPAAIDV